MKALYVHPMSYGDNDAVDGIGHGIDHTLGAAGIELRVVEADFRDAGWEQLAETAIDEAVELGFDAIVAYCAVPKPMEAALTRARERGVTVVSFARPPYPIDGSIVIPAFDQGMRMAEALADALEPGASIAIIPGPSVPEEHEEVMGMAHAAQERGLHLLNDIADERFHNLTEDRGARDATRAVLEAFPRIDGLLPYNDTTMLGALDVLEEAGRLGEMKIISRNGSPAAIDAVRAGRTYGTWDVDPPAIGRKVASLAIRRLVDGEELDGEVDLSPLGRLYTRDNLHRWRPYAERVPFTPFRIGLEG